jgi:hypothetical protein
MSLTDTGQKKIFENKTYYIVKGKNEKENTEYLQLNEDRTFKPTPTMFIYRELGKSKITASMHYEGLPYGVLKWFLEYVENVWGIELNVN